MGLDSIIKNNKNWDNNVNSVYINNNICKTFKEINRELEEDLKNGGKNTKYYEQNLERHNKNFKRLTEEEKKEKKKRVEERKNKKKFDNNNYL